MTAARFLLDEGRGEKPMKRENAVEAARGLLPDIRVDSALAKVGIVALVDEATGYQYERPQVALVKLFAGYLDAALAPWCDRIPMDFWQNLFRIIGTSIEREELASRADEIIVFLNEIVFRALSAPALYALLETAPQPENDEINALMRAHGLPELIDTGNPALDRHIVQVGVLLKLAQGRHEFDGMFKRAFGKERPDEHSSQIQDGQKTQNGSQGAH